MKRYTHLGHEAVSDARTADFYFAHLQGILRARNQVVDQINNRPRKCLGMKTPNQALFGITPPPVAL